VLGSDRTVSAIELLGHGLFLSDRTLALLERKTH
jgi:hypothetical protein